MKNSIISFVAGALLMLITVWLVKPQFGERAVTLQAPNASTQDSVVKTNIKSEKTSEPQTSVLTDNSTAAHNDEPGALAVSRMPEPTGESATDGSSANMRNKINEQTRKLLLNSEMTKAKRLLKNVLPRGSSKFEPLMTAAEELVSADSEIFDEINREFSIDDYFDEDGNPIERQVSAEEAALENIKMQDRLARREQNRQEFEDSARNLLSDSELEALRTQELALANRNDQVLLDYQIESIEDGVPDLNDYQFNEIKQLASSIEPLTFEDVPIGSQLSRPFRLNHGPEDRVTQFSEQVKTILSPTQQQALEEYRQQNVMVIDFEG